MSVIMGINLLDKLYLISDTRETIQFDDHNEYSNDLIKAFVLSNKCCAVAAGKTSAASFLLNGVQKRLQHDETLDEVMKIFKTKTKEIISEFVGLTGRHDKQIALIIAGFNDYKGKNIVASTLGEAMSGQLVAAGEGSFQQQTINPHILTALSDSISKQGELAGDSVITIPTLNSKMFTIVVDIRTNHVDLDEVSCYQYVIFHPDQKVEKIKLPVATFSYLDFRQRSDPYSDGVIYEDVEHIISFLYKEIMRRGFPTVGGHIFPLLQSPDGAVYPTGDIATIRNGRLVSLGGFFVDSQQGLSYKLSNGNKGVYRHLRDVKPYEITGESLI